MIFNFPAETNFEGGARKIVSSPTEIGFPCISEPVKLQALNIHTLRENDGEVEGYASCYRSAVFSLFFLSF